jgi:hypothetical protein
MDGVAQSDFLMGKSAKSARESVIIYIGNENFWCEMAQLEVASQGN